MKNYISINNQKIELHEDQVKQLVEAYGIQQKELAEYAAGSTVKVGSFEMVVLEQLEGQTAVILKGMYGEESEFVEILDTVNPDCWWWLATPWTTERHGNDAYAKCVSPSGYIGCDYYGDGFGVRPFCILKSTIFVSE